MSGEMSMAPMMTAVELTLRPRQAMKIAKMSIHNCAPLKLMEFSTFLMVDCSSFLSALMLNYFFNKSVKDISVCFIFL